MKSVNRKCSRCGNRGLHAKKRPAIRTVAGHSFKASVPALVCDSCGAVYFNGPALGDFDLAVANRLAGARAHWYTRRHARAPRRAAEGGGVTPPPPSGPPFSPPPGGGIVMEKSD